MITVPEALRDLYSGEHVYSNGYGTAGLGFAAVSGALELTTGPNDLTMGTAGYSGAFVLLSIGARIGEAVRHRHENV
jgi:acyl CoA:acetate/3-ketoacid CoA transferase alpha subunit